MISPDRSAAAVSRRIVTVLFIRISAAAVGVINAFVLARLLGPTGKGDFYLVQLVPSTQLVLGQLGLPSAIAYYAGRGQMTGLARRAMILALGLSLAGILLTLATMPLLTTSVFRDVPPGLVMLSLVIVPFVFVFTFGNAILTGRQRVGAYGAIALGQVVLALVLFVLLIGVLNLGATGAILAYIAYSGVAGIAVAIAAFRTPSVGADPHPTSWRALAGYGIRLYPATLSGFFSYRADVYLLALLGAGSAELGLYSIAVGLAELLFFLPDSVVVVFFPHVAGGTRDEADRETAVVTRVTLAMTALAALPLAAAAIVAVNVLLPAYVGSLPALFVLLPGVVMLSASKTLSAYLNGIGRGGIVSITALLSLAANIGLNLVLIPAYGIVGAAAASLVSYTFGAAMQLTISANLSGVSPLAFLVPRRDDFEQILVRVRDMLARVRARGQVEPMALAAADPVEPADSVGTTPSPARVLFAAPPATPRHPAEPLGRRVRVYVAAAPNAPLTMAALECLAANPAVDLVGVSFGRIDPERLRAAAPDILLSAAHEHLIHEPELAVARLGSVGLHPALLPRYRGSHPLWWALRNAERAAGLSLYVLEKGIDTGPVIYQQAVQIDPDDTFASLYRKVSPLAAPMLDALVAAAVADDAMPPGTPQDESMATVFRAPTDREVHGTLRSRAVRKVGRGLRRVGWGSRPGRRTP